MRVGGKEISCYNKSGLIQGGDFMDKRPFWNISYGVYLVTTMWKDKINGQIANAVMQVIAEPPKMAVAINKNNYTHELIENSGVFIIEILDKDTPMSFIGRFGFRTGREINKFEGIEYEKGVTGAPIVKEHVVGYLECRVEKSLDVGTHTIFVGEVVRTEYLKDAEPMTYAYYHKVKNGKAPKSAPVDYEDRKESGKMEEKKKYVCKVCGYVYDPANGDPDHGIEPGTAFEDLPEDWTCPLCGVPKSEFEPVE